MSKIIMDEYGHETYDSLEQALGAWSDLAAAEEGCASIQLDLAIESYGMESSQVLFGLEELVVSTEGIKDAVKNMASKAKSNIVMWAKKFINFFFSWVINFIKGNINIRKAIKSSYDKAKKYLKGLHKLATKLGSDNDKTIVVHAGHGTGPAALASVLISTALLNEMVKAMNDVFNEIKAAPKEELSECAQIATAAFSTLCVVVGEVAFTAEIPVDASISKAVSENFSDENIDKLINDKMSMKRRFGGQPYNEEVLKNAAKGEEPKQDKKSEEKVEDVDFKDKTPEVKEDKKSDFEKVTGVDPEKINAKATEIMNTPVVDAVKACFKFMGNTWNKLKNLKKSFNKSTTQDNTSSEPKGLPAPSDTNNKAEAKNESYSLSTEAEEQQNSGDAKFKPDDLNKLMDQAKTVVETAVKQMTTQEEFDNQTVEVSYEQAYKDIRFELNRFITIAEANKDLWNFEKTAQGLEKIRRNLTSAADQLSTSGDKEDEKAGQLLFSKIIAVGNFTALFTKAVNQQGKLVVSSIDKLLLDGTKLGSKLTTLGGK